MLLVFVIDDLLVLVVDILRRNQAPVLTKLAARRSIGLEATLLMKFLELDSVLLLMLATQSMRLELRALAGGTSLGASSKYTASNIKIENKRPKVFNCGYHTTRS
jgi:hypothetical protein